MPPCVLCPDCDREYPEGRFAHGRTLHCACGTLVGRDYASGVPELGGEPRFLADSMLGGLARWLRTLGYDAAWEEEIADSALARRGAEEGRWVLTLDRGLPRHWWADHLVLLQEGTPLQQLTETVRRFGLRTEPAFSRCTRCNLELGPAPPDLLRRRAPPSLAERGIEAHHCPACQRLYWQGSHTRRMRRTLREVLHPPDP